MCTQDFFCLIGTKTEVFPENSYFNRSRFGEPYEKSSYGRQYMGNARVTFLIDEKGVIEKVDTKNHAAQLV